MKPANKQFLDDHRDCLTEIVNAQTATRSNKVKGDFLRIMQEEFLPGYAFSDDCGDCLFTLTTLLYRRYDEYLAQQPTLAHMAATFPSNEPRGYTNDFNDNKGTHSKHNHRR